MSERGKKDREDSEIAKGERSRATERKVTERDEEREIARMRETREEEIEKEER